MNPDELAEALKEALEILNADEADIAKSVLNAIPPTQQEFNS